MSSGRRCVVLCLLFGLVLSGLGAVVPMAVSPLGASPAGASPAGDPAGEGDARVLVVTLPRLTWERLSEADTPAIDAFLADAAVGSTSIRTIGPITTPAEAYLSLGAGNRSAQARNVAPGRVLMATESIDAGSAAEVFARRTGVEPTGRLLAIDFPGVQRVNDDLLYGARPGSLGQALGEAGIGVGAIGNADVAPLDTVSREVGLAVVDEDGQAPFGEVGPGLLVADPTAPLGVRSDPVTVAAATDRALGDGARVLFVEMSDLERAELARAESTDRQGDELYDEALRAADRQFADLLESFDASRDMVVLVGPTAPLEDEQLTVFAARAPSLEPGWARSATTRRDGYVSLADIPSTILHHLGVEVPEDMHDTPISASGAGGGVPLAERVDDMVTDNERATFRDDAVGPLTVTYIVLLVLMLVLVAWGVGRRWERTGLLELSALVVMAVPPSAYIGGLLPYGGFTTATYGLALLAVAIALALVCWGLGRSVAVLPPVLLAGFSVALLVADVLTGAHLQIDTIFGYSPIVAGRFAGFGNQAFSLLSVSTLLVASGGWQLSLRSDRWTDRRRLAAVLALFAVVVVVVGAPMWGSDVGGVLASVPAFAVCTLLMTGRRIRVRTLALIGVATVAVLGAFAALDLSRPVASRTHLGRFAARIADGEVGVILTRKLNANLSVLTSTVWALVIPAALLFFAYLTWRPNRILRRINGRWPMFRPFGISAITLGVVAWALNDSGVSMPAMMLTVALPYTALLALDAGTGDAGTGDVDRP